MSIVVNARWRVDATAWLDVPLRASAVWGQMRDIQRFLTIDPLHRRVRVADERVIINGAIAPDDLLINPMPEVTTSTNSSDTVRSAL